MMIVALMSVCVFAQPAPELGETVAEYFDRYEVWVDSIPEDQRAWGEVEAIDRAIKDRSNGLRLARSPSDDSWEQSVLFVETNRDLVDRVLKVSRIPYLAMPRDEMEGEASGVEGPPAIGLLLPHLGMLWTQERLILIEAKMAFRQGDTDRMIECIESSNRLADFVPLSGSSIEMSVGIAMTSTSISPLMGRRVDLSKCSDANLVRLSKLFHSIDQDRIVDAGMFEQWGLEDLINWLYQDSKNGRLTIEGSKRLVKLTREFESISDGKASDSDPGLSAMFVRNKVLPMHDQRQAAKEYFEAVHMDLSTPPHLLRSFRSAEVMDGLLEEEFKFAPVSIFAIEFERLYSRWMMHQSEKAAFQILVAAHRYNLRHGSFPTSLESIDSDLFTVDVIDLYTGESMGYKFVDGQPMIYSVGPDRDGDGGKPVFDKDGNPEAWPEFLTLDELEAINATDPASIDGDWILYPMNQ